MSIVFCRPRRPAGSPACDPLRRYFQCDCCRRCLSGLASAFIPSLSSQEAAMIPRFHPGMSEAELRALLKAVKIRLIAALDREPLDSPLMFELFDEMKAIKHQLGEKLTPEELD